IYLQAVLSHLTVPTTPMENGSIAKIHVETALTDFNGSDGFSLTSPWTPVTIPTTGQSGVMVPITPEGAPGPGQGDGSVCVYTHALDGSWFLRGLWDWTAGTTLSLSAYAGIDAYRVVPCSGHYSVDGVVVYPLQAAADTPLGPTTL